MSAEEDIQRLHRLAAAHYLSAAQHGSAAHHHRQAAFELEAGNGARAKQRSISATEHTRRAHALSATALEDVDDDELDVDFETIERTPAKPNLMSNLLRTACCPSAPHSDMSFCCSAKLIATRLLGRADRIMLALHTGST